MYIVRFVRKDGKPDEEYYYHRLEDAQKHVDLFKDDDSGLYEKIEMDYFEQERRGLKLIRSLLNSIS